MQNLFARQCIHHVIELTDQENPEQVRPPPPREQRTDMCQKKASGGMKETLSDVTVKEKRPKKKRVCVG